MLLPNQEMDLVILIGVNIGDVTSSYIPIIVRNNVGRQVEKMLICGCRYVEEFFFPKGSIHTIL